MLRPDRLGLALRFLRTRHNLRQRDVAERAGITGSMLSGYENGRKVPTLASLDKILQAMSCGLRDLVEALEKTSPPGSGGDDDAAPPSGSGGPVPGAGSGSTTSPKAGSEAGSEAASLPRLRFDLQVIFGPAADLGREEEKAFHEMLQGYCRWLRYLRDTTRGDDEDDPEGAPAVSGA